MSPPLEPAVGSQDSGPDHPSQIATGHQNDIPCLDGDIGAGLDRDGRVRWRQSKRVIDAVTDESHALACAVQTGADPGFYFSGSLFLNASG
jgi:hypothetical protein